MKTALMILIITTFSCINKDLRTVKINTGPKQIEKYNQLIIGSWKICKSIGVKGQISYNKCKVINFMNDGTGKIIFPSKEICDFKWEVRNTKIFFTFDSENDKKLFISNNYEYDYSIYKKGNGFIFELIDEKIHHRFILSK